MRVSEAIEIFERVRKQGGDPELVVPVQSEGGLGGTAAEAVTAMYVGFDWDMGKVLIRTARPVIALSAEEVEAIRASVRQGGSWHAYQAQKRLRERIAELERQLSEATAAK